MAPPPACLDLTQLQRVVNFLGIGGPPKRQPTVKIGVLGASQVATYAMIWPARRVPGAEVVAVAARDGERAATYAKEHCIPRSYGSYSALLADPSVDAVYVGLPNGLHGQWAQAALEAGKHVLCEKPFTANEQEAREVQAVAKAKRLLCREAFHYREHPLMDHVRGLLAPGNAQAVAAAERAALGALRSIDVQVLIPAWVFGGANIRWQETLAGGAMMDAGCYCLHVLRTLGGPVAQAAGVAALPEVVGATATMAPASTVVDAAMSGSLRWPLPGAALRGSFTASLQHTGPLPQSTIQVVGERGTLSVDNFIMPVFGNRVVLSAATTTTSAAGAPAGGDKPPSLLPWLGISSGPTTVWRVYGSGESTYQHQLQRFVADVRAVKEAEGSGDKGLLAACSRLLEEDAADCTANMALLDAVYLRAGLRPRLPSAQAMALAARSAEAAAAAAAGGAGGADGQLTVRGS